MAFWDSIVSGGIKGAAEAFGTMAKDISVAITGNDPLTAAQKAEIQQKLIAVEAVAMKAAADYDTAQMTGQIDLMKLDAQSGDRFRSWGRPAAIWICVSGLAYSLLLQPTLPWIVDTACLVFGNPLAIKPLPNLDGPTLLTLASSLLGLGGMRTVDKIKGIGK